MMVIEDNQYSVTLSIANATDILFSVFTSNLENGTFELIFEQSVPKALSLSCKSMDDKGYVAIAFNLTENIQAAQEGSPVYEVSENKVTAVQYFPNLNVKSFHLIARGNELFLFHSYENIEGLKNMNCKKFKWTGFSFQIIDELPCQNTKGIAPFVMRGNLYIAIANYKNQEGYLATNSRILKFDLEQNKFVAFQKLKTYGAVDVKYFYVTLNSMEKQHFIVFANSVSPKNERDITNAESFIYKFEGSKFVPYQQLKIFGIIKFLPLNVSLL